MSQLKHRQLSGRLAQIIERMYMRIALRATRDWPDVELTTTQIHALALLGQAPCRMSELAEGLEINLPSVTVIIDRLVDKGLVERDRDTADRRVVMCRLSPSGEKEITRFWRMGRLSLIDLTKKLTDEELEKVVEAFEIIERSEYAVTS